MPSKSHSLLALLAVAAATTSVSASSLTNSKKNIILFLTDDQDITTFDKKEYLPNIQKHLVDEGQYFANFFAPVSVCCPSRVSLLRTQLAHNHNITFVTSPWGGWNVFNEYGYVNHHLPDFLQHAGYKTFYVGKYMNEHTTSNCASKPVSGWDGSDFLVDPHTYDYWHPAISHDNQEAVEYPGTYSTDLVAELANKQLDEALSKDEPFFLGIAPIASHSWISSPGKGGWEDDPDLKTLHSDIPATHPRHARLFTDVQAPRVPSWNKRGGVSWVRDLPELNSTVEAYLDEFYRGRLRSLQAVDELVDQVIQKLADAGKLEDTYIFYTADNGYSFGRHRRQPGKTLAFEEDIHVPLVVRGPGVPKGVHNTLSSHSMVDLSATILDIAGAATDYEHDGKAIPITSQDLSLVHHKSARHAIQEYWVLGVTEGFYTRGNFANNTYRNLRVHDEDEHGKYSWSYSVWCTGERELYDLERDPYQLHNILEGLNRVGPFAPFDSTSHKKPLLSKHQQQLLNRLDALTLVLKTCKGEVCANPYKALFPDFTQTGGEISTLNQASSEQYDSYFKGLPKVQFSTCALGYQSRLEKPEWEDSWSYGGSIRGSGPLLFRNQAHAGTGL